MFENGLLIGASRLVASSALVMACFAGTCTTAFAFEGSEAATEVYVEFDASKGSDQPSNGALDDDKPEEGGNAKRGKGSSSDEASVTSTTNDGGADSGTGKGSGRSNAAEMPDGRQSNGAGAADHVPATSSKPSAALPQTGDVVLPVCVAWVAASAAVLVASLLLRRKRGDEK